MDVIDINPHVIERVENLCQDPDMHTRNWMILSFPKTIVLLTRHDASFAVKKLETCLTKEQAENCPRTFGLQLVCDCLMDEAVDVFSEFLRRTIQLPALSLGMGDLQSIHIFHHLLEAIHNNTSVKQLRIIYPLFYADDDDVGNDEIDKLLSHKTDLEDVWFAAASSKSRSFLISILARGYPSLRKLGFHRCGIDDLEIQLIIEALVEGNLNRHLEALDLRYNYITPHGLRSLSELLTPTAFPFLQKLKLSENYVLLNDTDITQHFVQEILLVQGTCLKELYISRCGARPVGCSFIIKALETNHMLNVLEMTSSQEQWNSDSYRSEAPFRRQLVTSLPKMKGIQRLKLGYVLERQDRDLIMTAVAANTSLVEFII